jgi:uncharacterized protein YbaP (TraB family)
MNLGRKVLICLVLGCIALGNYAQQHYPKTLLWRISGKGLTQPSYLFGTMHLNDKRLFDFGDSVYSAIERTAGLAIEVNPDELCAYYVNQLFDELENSKKLGEILDEKEFKKYKNALSKKFDKPAEDITTRDIVKEKNKWMQDLMVKGEMQTFVDAYLFNIARRQGKWLGGIEDMSDQAGLMEDLVDRSDIVYLLANDSTIARESGSELNNMIDLYISQDLGRIEATYNSPSSAKTKDLLLTRRNIKMARRIDSLVALRTMFLAIGAAHLPGDSGVIHLLQNRGFTVEPVFSSKKIAAKEYKFEEVQLPWVEVKDEQDLYKVEMPANPASVKLFGLMEMKFLFDIFNMSGFCTMAVINPGHSINKDTMMDQLTQRMFSGRQVEKPTNIIKDGVQGKEYIQKQDGSHIRLQIFAFDKVVYMAVLASMKKDAVSSADADKFFKSFTINKNQSVASGMRPFTDSIMGITVNTPSFIAHNKQFSVQNDESYKITAYTGTDAGSGSYIMLFSREVKPGYYIVSDSTVYEEFYNNLERQYDQLKKQEIIIQGQKAAMVSGRNIKQPEIFAKALSVVKNNRNIMLMVIGDSSHILGNSINDIFNSLRFIDPPVMNWKNYQTPDNNSSAWAPSPFRFHEEDSKMRLIAYDTATATTYFITPDTIATYYWVKNDSAFWAEALDDDFDEKVIYEKTVQNGDVPGREYLWSKGSVYTRIRIMPTGNIIYKTFLVGGRELVESENANNFFESFRLQSPYVKPVYLESKAKILLEDLQHTDSAKRLLAYASLNAAPYTKEHLPMLHEALFKSYADPFNESDSFSVNERLGEIIAAINDPSTITSLEEQYPLLTGEKEGLKPLLLTTLAKMRTQQSYSALTRLMKDYIPKDMPDYRLTSALKDSLALTAAIYPSLQQQLAKDAAFGPIVADLALTLIDSGFIKQTEVAKAETDFLESAGNWVETLKQSDSLQWRIYRLLTLIGSFNTPASNDLLQEFTQVKSNYYRKEMVLLLLKNKQYVPAYVLDSIAADREIRSSFYDELKDLKQATLFPKKYKTQILFAESDMYNAASDEESPDTMEFLRLQKATYKGKVYNFYLYKVHFDMEDESHTYLGIAGAYDRSGKKPEQVLYLGGVYYPEEFDASRVHEMMEKFLQEQSEEE